MKKALLKGLFCGWLAFLLNILLLLGGILSFRWLVAEVYAA